MIFYHGSPLSGDMEQQVLFFGNRHVLISWATFESSHIPITEVCSSFCIDNGAFSFWKSGESVNWDNFYKFLDKWIHHPKFDFFLIPDVIGGSEKENQGLVNLCTYREFACPVYHVGESLTRIKTFMNQGFRRMAIGTTKGYSLKSLNYWNEMRKVFDFICKDGIPQIKVHGLRMLDPEIVSKFPFSSGDSTTAVRRSVYDSVWSGYPYSPMSKSARATLVADKIERCHSPSFYKPQPIQEDLL